MEQKQNQNQANKAPEERGETSAYLNHGVDSLVAMDNPDDSQLGAEQQAPKRGSRR